jgi:predicted permease
VYRPDEDVFVRTNSVSAGYIPTMGMSLVAGRDIRADDRGGSPRVAVINETMARYYWGTVQAVGRRFGLARDTGNEIEVVGVVRNAHTERLRESPERMVFLPYQQDTGHLRSLSLAVRTTTDSAAIVPLLRDRLRQIAPTLPVTTIGTVDDNVHRLLLAERIAALLSTFFGVIAGLLTALGLYGVMAYTTSRRRREIAIRMALGSGRARTLGLVARGNFALVAVGVAIGLSAAWLTLRTVGSMFFGVSATDGLTMAAATALMLLVAAVASYIPARRATRTDPALVLRGE